MIAQAFIRVWLRLGTESTTWQDCCALTPQVSWLGGQRRCGEGVLGLILAEPGARRAPYQGRFAAVEVAVGMDDVDHGAPDADLQQRVADLAQQGVHQARV